MATLVGVDLPNTRLMKFEDAIASGELLLMVDVPRTRVEEIEAVVKPHHPEANVQGTDPTIPAFPCSVEPIRLISIGAKSTH